MTVSNSCITTIPATTPTSDPQIKIEDVWFFQPDLDVEEMEKAMFRYRLEGVFAITKGKEKEEYSLFVYRKKEGVSTIDSYDLCVSPNGIVIKADESTFHTTLETALKEGAKAYLPFAFLSSLEERDIYLPQVTNEEMQQKITNLEQLIGYYHLKEDLKFPLETMAFRTSSNGMLGIYYLHIHPKSPKSSFSPEIIYLNENDFNSDFRLEIKTKLEVTFSKTIEYFLNPIDLAFVSWPTGLPLLQFEAKIKQAVLQLEDKIKRELYLVEIEDDAKIQEFLTQLSNCPPGFFVLLYQRGSASYSLLIRQRDAKGKLSTEQIPLSFPKTWSQLHEMVLRKGGIRPFLKSNRDSFIFGCNRSGEICDRFDALPPPPFPVYAILAPSNDVTKCLFFERYVARPKEILCHYEVEKFEFRMKPEQQVSFKGAVPFNRYASICKVTQGSPTLPFEERIKTLDGLFSRFEKDFGFMPFSNPLLYILGFTEEENYLDAKDIEQTYRSLLDANKETIIGRILQKYFILWKLKCHNFSEVEKRVKEISTLHQKYFSSTCLGGAADNSLASAIEKELSHIFGILNLKHREQIDDIQTGLETYLSLLKPDCMTAGNVRQSIRDLENLKQFIPEDPLTDWADLLWD